MARWLRPGPVLDAAVVVLVLGVDVAAMIFASVDRDHDLAPLSAPAVVVAAVGAGALWWRRRAPLAVLAVVVAALAAAPALLDEQLASHASGLVAAVALFAVGAWSERRRAPWVVAAVLALLVFAGVRDEGNGVGESAAVAGGFVGLPIVAGRAARARRRELEEAARRVAAAEAERDERARRAVADERAHIARELHDVVAHHVSLIGVQAGAARVALDSSPASARGALLAIEQASREAVGEMRHLLDALRDGGSDGAPLVPQPGLADLDALADGFRGAGLHVDLAVDGDGDPPGPAVELVCYRIVEEALTNVARHSAARRATVEVAVDALAVRISVRDPGPALGDTVGTGRGHLGMTERVALFGGRLDVGPDREGGFTVEAAIPRATS